jgi:hypothetical protein
MRNCNVYLDGAVIIEHGKIVDKNMQVPRQKR